MLSKALDLYAGDIFNINGCGTRGGAHRLIAEFPLEHSTRAAFWVNRKSHRIAHGAEAASFLQAAEARVGARRRSLDFLPEVNQSSVAQPVARSTKKNANDSTVASSFFTSTSVMSNEPPRRTLVSTEAATVIAEDDNRPIGTKRFVNGPPRTMSSFGEGPTPRDKTFLLAIEIIPGLGLSGLDRFYLGSYGTALAKLLTAGGGGVVAILDWLVVMANCAMGHKSINFLGINATFEPETVGTAQVIAQVYLLGIAIASGVMIGGAANMSGPRAEEQGDRDAPRYVPPTFAATATTAATGAYAAAGEAAGAVAAAAAATAAAVSAPASAAPAAGTAATNDAGYSPPSGAPYGSPDGREYNLPNAAPYASPSDAPYGSPNNATYGSPHDAPVAPPSYAPYGSPDGREYNSPNDAPYAPPSDAPYGSPNSAPYGSPNDTPYAPPSSAPDGSTNNAPSGSPNDELSAPQSF